MPRLRGLHLTGCPAEQGRGVVSLVMSGEHFFPPEYFSVFMGLDPANPFPVFVTVAPVTCAILLCPGVSTTIENVLLLQNAVSCCVVA